MIFFLDLVGEDTAFYTCTASSESGETSWSASLSVEDPKNPNIMFHKTPDPATFPKPPTKPKIVDRRSTSVTLSWRRHSPGIAGSGGSTKSATGVHQMGPLIGYTLEYFSSDLETGWVTAAHRITRYPAHMQLKTFLFLSSIVIPPVMKKWYSYSRLESSTRYSG